MEYEDKIKLGASGTDHHAQAQQDIISITSLLGGGASKFGTSQPRKKTMDGPADGCCGGGASESEEGSGGCGWGY